MRIASKDIPKLSALQRKELVRCYCLWCGVLPGDDLRLELASGKRHIDEILKSFGKADVLLTAEIDYESEAK